VSHAGPVGKIGAVLLCPSSWGPIGFGGQRLGCPSDELEAALGTLVRNLQQIGDFS
jgi:hypothetical protein